MKLLPFQSALALGAMLAWASNAAAEPSVSTVPAPAASTNAIGPRIQFQTPVYDWGKVKSSEIVKYTFVFTNTGDQALEISAVRPGCGCTTAGDFTKRIEPKATGTIPIQVNTAGFNGPVTKFVTVQTSDPRQPSLSLQLKGTIWKPVDVMPAVATITVPPDAQQASAIVRIMNNMEEPLWLISTEIGNPAFKTEVVTNQPGKEYQVVVSVAAPFPEGNSFQGSINIRTSSTNVPTITFTSFAMVQPVLTVYPAQIMLPPRPLANKISSVFYINNNLTNFLTLSNAVADVPGVEISINSMEPGKRFSVMAAFPAGFDAPEGKPTTLTVQTSNPRYPLIKVPVIQQPRSPTAISPVAHSAMPSQLPPPPRPLPVRP